METASLAVSSRLEALIRHDVGWQLDDLRVVLNNRGVVLEGHARCAFAKRLAQDSATRWTGLPVENKMEVN
jgi:osmotically-inducible protein OsmY